MALEVLPEIAPVKFEELTLERLQPVVPDEEVDKALERIARSRRESEPVERAAESGDRVVIDFAGSVDGTAFEGGSAKDCPLELGSGEWPQRGSQRATPTRRGDSPRRPTSPSRSTRSAWTSSRSRRSFGPPGAIHSWRRTNSTRVSSSG